MSMLLILSAKIVMFCKRIHCNYNPATLSWKFVLSFSTSCLLEHSFNCALKYLFLACWFVLNWYKGCGKFTNRVLKLTIFSAVFLKFVSIFIKYYHSYFFLNTKHFIENVTLNAVFIVSIRMQLIMMKKLNTTKAKYLFALGIPLFYKAEVLNFSILLKHGDNYVCYLP